MHARGDGVELDVATKSQVTRSTHWAVGTPRPSSIARGCPAAPGQDAGLPGHNGVEPVLLVVHGRLGVGAVAAAGVLPAEPPGAPEVEDGWFRHGRASESWMPSLHPMDEGLGAPRTRPVEDLLLVAD